MLYAFLSSFMRHCSAYLILDLIGLTFLDEEYKL